MELAYASFFYKLVQHVSFEGDVITAGALHQRDWGIAVRTFLPSRVKRQCTSYWKEYPVAILKMSFRGRDLYAPQQRKRESERPGSSAGLPFRAGASCSSAGCSERSELAQRVCSAAHRMIAILAAARSFFAEFASRYSDEVLWSHGDHVSRELRNSAAYAWFLPELLKFDFVSMKRRDLASQACFWLSREDSVRVLLDFAKSRPAQFEWPSHSAVAHQYRHLIMHWSHLSREPDIESLCWNDNGDFRWEAWWATCHTNRVCSSTGVRHVCFVPAGTEAAFTLFHDSGSLGLSEAHCESVASLLKRYSKSWTTDRVKFATMLRAHGVTGTGRDDGLLLVSWAKFVAGSGKETFSFDYKNRRSAAKKRPHGDGSRVVERHIAAACGPQTWSFAELEAVAADMKADDLPQGSTRWLRELAAARTWEHR